MNPSRSDARVSLRLRVAEGPVQRIEWFYTPDGTGHPSLEVVARYAIYQDRDSQPTHIQHVVEYVGPWMPIEDQTGERHA